MDCLAFSVYRRCTTCSCYLQLLSALASIVRLCKPQYMLQGVSYAAEKAKVALKASPYTRSVVSMKLLSLSLSPQGCGAWCLTTDPALACVYRGRAKMAMQRRQHAKSLAGLQVGGCNMSIVAVAMSALRLSFCKHC